MDSAGIDGLRHAGPDSFHAGDSIRDLWAIRRHTESYPRNLRRAPGDLLLRPDQANRGPTGRRRGLRVDVDLPQARLRRRKATANAPSAPVSNSPVPGSGTPVALSNRTSSIKRNV